MERDAVVREPEKDLPVRYSDYDVVVAGGGVAGIAAALSVARCGKRVLLLERMYSLGGLATLGLITIYLPLCDGCGHQLSFGIAEELLKLSISRGWERTFPDTWLKAGGHGNSGKIENSGEYMKPGEYENPGEHEKSGKKVQYETLADAEHGSQRYEVRFNAQMFSILADELLVREGVKILYGTLVASVLKSSDRLTYLIAENKDGRFAIPVRSAVDATGDADVFYKAKVPCREYAKGNIPAAWFYETRDGANTLRMVGAADVLPSEKDTVVPAAMNGSRISGTDADEISEAVIRSHARIREVFLEGGPVSEEHSLSTIAQVPQLRMTRRIQGIYTLDESESKHSFSDSIGMIGDWRKRGPAFEIPLRTLYSEELVNCMAAGRIISVTDDMWDISRVIPACAVTGQAAGTAMALSDDIHALEADQIQEALQRQGVKLHFSSLKDFTL